MSNQEAIALLRNLEDSLDSYCELSEEGKTAFRMAIEALSSSEFPNSSDTDTISRQAAIEAIEAEKIANGRYLTSSYVGYEFAETVIGKLPSIQPKRGKWNRPDMDTFNCNQCGATFVLNQGSEKMHFCPNCLADMREVNHESN